MFTLTAISTDPAVIQAADKAGVDRIGIDIERLGKHQRQGHNRSARISDHLLTDLAALTANAKHARVFIRVNPIHAESKAEITQALDLGAQVIMLPYFTGPAEVATFVELLAGRARAVLLLETALAVSRIDEIVAVKGIDEIMVGLNDLQISLGLSNPFEILASDLISSTAARIRDAGLSFGLGGLARANDQTLPVSPDAVYAQYPRLGATSAWLARSFFKGIEPREIAPAVKALRKRLDYWFAQPAESLERERRNLAATVRALGASA